MIIWIIYYCIKESGDRFEISERVEVESASELENVYRSANDWIAARNNDQDQREIGNTWGWNVELGELKERGIDATLLLVIFEMVEDVLRIWLEEGKNVMAWGDYEGIGGKRKK